MRFVKYANWDKPVGACRLQLTSNTQTGARVITIYSKQNTQSRDKPLVKCPGSSFKLFQVAPLPPLPLSPRPRRPQALLHLSVLRAS